LRSHSKTLEYEFKMLCAVAHNIADGKLTGDWGSNNAHVESFAIHCRNLIFFFYAHDTANNAGRARPSDILAADYFIQNADWGKACPPISAALTNAKPQADKQVAHITEERRELNQPSGPTASWKICGIVRDVATVTKAFLDHVPQQNIDGNVKTALEQLATAVLSATQSPSPPSMPVPAKPAPPSVNPSVNFRAKTDVRTIAPPSGGMFGLHGKTEP
jgi:hypothetical protein